MRIITEIEREQWESSGAAELYAQAASLPRHVGGAIAKKLIDASIEAEDYRVERYWGVVEEAVGGFLEQAPRAWNSCVDASMLDFRVELYGMDTTLSWVLAVEANHPGADGCGPPPEVDEFYEKMLDRTMRELQSKIEEVNAEAFASLLDAVVECRSELGKVGGQWDYLLQRQRETEEVAS